MKRIKIGAMALLAIVTGASAFTTKDNNKAFSGTTYFAIATVNVDDQNFYQVVTASASHPTCGTGTAHVCKIHTNGDVTTGGKILTTDAVIVSKRSN